MKISKDSIPYVIVFTFLSTIVFVVFLAIGNQLTQPRIQQNLRFAERSAVLRAFGIDFADPADAAFESQVRVSTRPDGALYEATVEGTEYLAVRQSGPGLWGTITAIVAAKPGTSSESGRIRGVEVVSHNETPGLGGRIDEAWFKAQFRDKRVGEDGSIRVDQNGSGKGEKDKEVPRVDAITGATWTSNYIQGIVNAALVRLRAEEGAK
jgi:Na+-transporting NADH:ubiquinone oxidoreductase subunit C